MVKEMDKTGRREKAPRRVTVVARITLRRQYFFSEGYFAFVRNPLLVSAWRDFSFVRFPPVFVVPPAR